jgi:hypothetical protein
MEKFPEEIQGEIMQNLASLGGLLLVGGIMYVISNVLKIDGNSLSKLISSKISREQ